MKFVATFFKYATDDEIRNVFNYSSIGDIFNTYSETDITKKCQDYIREKYEKCNRKDEYLISENPDKEDKSSNNNSNKNREGSYVIVRVNLMSKELKDRLFLILALLNIHCEDGIQLLYAKYKFDYDIVEIGFVEYYIRCKCPYRISVPIDWVDNYNEDDLKNAIYTIDSLKLPNKEVLDYKVIDEYLCE